jgi:putative ABC transport system permease protein
MTDAARTLRAAIRSVLARPGFAAAVVITFALGVGATTALFSFVDALLLRPLPFADPDRLVRIQPVRGREGGPISALEVRDIREQSTLIADIASFRGSQYIVSGDGVPENARAAMASFNLFRVLGIRPYLGATWPESYDRTRVFAVVLSYELWKRRFAADPTVIGRAVTLDAYPYTVLGVLPPGFDFPNAVGIYRRVPGGDFESRSVRTAGAVARLKPGVTVPQVQRELDAISARIAAAFPESNRGVRFVVSPLRDYWMGAARPYLAALAGAVACVLLVACANIAALLLARATAREREIAVRAALGATRQQLVGQLLIETLVLAVAGGAVGLFAAHLSARMLAVLVRSELPAWMTITLDLRLATFAVVSAIVAGVASGIVPALRGSAIVPSEALKAGGRGGGGFRAGLLRRLVVAQLALAIVLVTGAGLMGKSLAHLRATDLGFPTDHLLAFKIDPPWSGYDRLERTDPFYRRVLDAIRRIPSVRSATTDDAPPIVGMAPREGPHKNLPTVEGAEVALGEQTPYVNLHMVSPGYFDVLGVPIRRGRGIADQDEDPWAPVAVVSERLAATLWPRGDAVGRRLRLGDLDANYNLRETALDTTPRWVTVVGLAANVREQVTTADGGLDLYVSNRQHFTPETYVLIRTRDDPQAVLAAARDAVWSVDPGIALFDVRAMDERIDDSVWQTRLASALARLFGLLALVLATVGVYGVMSFSIAQRKSEFGVYAALGATGGRITSMVLREAAVLAGTGVAMGVVAVAALARPLARVLTGVRGVDSLSLIASSVVIAAGTLVAAYLPARRAARSDPVDLLR